MGRDNRAADGEPQPGPAPRRLLLAAREGFEDLILAPFRQPRPVVLEAHLDVVADRSRGNREVRAGRRVSRDISGEAHEDALHESGVERNLRQPVGDVHRQLVLGEHRAQRAHPRVHDVGDRAALELEPDFAALDAGLMQRVFVSLAGNVAKHTPAGTQLTIGARAVDEEIEVSFEDNGPGLPKGREEEIFESFARGEKQATRRGAGLGLAISRAIVAAQGGSIRAETPDSGKGAKIVIRLPLRR